MMWTTKVVGIIACPLDRHKLSWICRFDCSVATGFRCVF